MFASDPAPVDPEPFLGQRDLTELDWEQSWDHLSADTCDDDWDPAEELDLDAELRALLDSPQSFDPVSSSAGTPDDAALGAVLAQLAERTETALALESHEAALAPLDEWSDAAIVAEAAQMERLSRWAIARGYELVHQLATRRPEPSGDPEEAGLSAYAVDEIAVAAGISRWAACRRVAEADALTQRHPQLLLALSAGCVAAPAVQRVLDATAVLDPADCAVVEQRLLARAGRPVLTDLHTASPEILAALTTDQVMAVSAKANPAWVGRVARELAQLVDPAAAKRRQARAKAGRSVRLELTTDGMAWLSAHVPAAQAVAAYGRLDGLAKALPDDFEDGHPDERSMDAKRADVLTGLLLGAAVSPEGNVTPPAPVHVHVIIDGRAGGAGDEHPRMPGEIARLGRVTADTVRDLLDLVDDTAGEVDGALALDQPCPGQAVHAAEGPGPYAPPEKLKNLLRVRHRSCVFPGCARPSRRCELDHTVRYPGGPTCSCNLAPLCKHHHNLKHHAPGWQLTNHGDGRLTWTTPTGQRIQVGDVDIGDVDIG